MKCQSPPFLALSLCHACTSNLTVQMLQFHWWIVSKRQVFRRANKRVSNTLALSPAKREESEESEHAFSSHIVTDGTCRRGRFFLPVTTRGIEECHQIFGKKWRKGTRGGNISICLICRQHLDIYGFLPAALKCTNEQIPLPPCSPTSPHSPR